MPSLIARDDQLKQLHSNLYTAVLGQLQIVFVIGEAGVGKTTLVEAFVDQAKHAVPQLLAVTSKCHAISGGQQEAYLPFVEILERISREKKGNNIWDRLRQGMVELAPDWLQNIPVIGGVIVAAIRTAQWGHREFSHQSADTDPRRLMVQYTNALRLASATAPLLLWIDDLHWSDNATLDLISFLADHASDTPILLITAYRPTDIGFDGNQPHIVRRLVDKLKRYQQCTELIVPSFALEDVEQFLSMSGHQLPPAFIRRIWHQAGGNPLFVKEFVTLLHARQLVKREGNAYVLVQPDIGVQIPPTIKAVIEQRLSLIESDLRQLLSYASVQGERFASRVLAQLLNTAELDVLGKLNLLDRGHRLIHELEAQHLIVKVGAEYQFIHTLIQQVIYNDLSTGQRRELHLMIAELLENLYGEEAPQYAADLAVHFERGGAPTRAVRYYLQASRTELARLALDDALIHAMSVRRVASQVGNGIQTMGWHVDALICMVEAYFTKSDYEAVMVACDEGEALCQQGNFAEPHACFLYWRQEVLYSTGRVRGAVELLRQALAVLGSEPADRRLQGMLYAGLGRLYGALTLDEMRQAQDKALEIGRQFNLPVIKFKALSWKGWIALIWADRPEEALGMGREALAIAEKHNFIIEQALGHRLIAYACRHLQRNEEALFHNQQAVILARRSGVPAALTGALSSLAIYWRQVGENLQEGLRTVHEAIAIADQYQFMPFTDVFEEWFAVTFGLGLWQEAEQVLERFCAAVPDVYPRGWFYYRLQGYLHYARGRFNDAIKSYVCALRILRQYSPDERDMRIIQPSLGLALLAVGDLRRGVKHLEAAQMYWKSRSPWLFAQSLRGLAQADFLRGNSTQAVARLGEALSAVEGSYSENAWPTWPQVCCDLGRVLLVTGKLDEALRHALVAYEKFKKMHHFLLGEAAFVVGQSLVAQGNQSAAVEYLYEARNEWERLALFHHLRVWEVFMQEQGLADES